MIDWFFERQTKFALFIGIICISIISLFDFRGVQAIIFLFIALLLIFLGQKLYSTDTSENWIRFSYSDSIKKICGGVLIFVGWLIFLRQVLALAISSFFLKTL